MPQQWLGYQALMEMAGLPPYPLAYRRGQSTSLRRNTSVVDTIDHRVFFGRGLTTVYREQRETLWVPAHTRDLANPLVQAELALRHEPLNLAVLAQALPTLVTPREVAEFVKARPTSTLRRRLWFLYEFLTDTRIPLPDLSSWTTPRRYVGAQDPDIFVVAAPGVRSARHGVYNNLLGTPEFCPVVRRTELLTTCLQTDYIGEFREFVEVIQPEMRQDISDHLFVVETRDSFALEEVELTPHEGRRFVSLLHQAHEQDFLSLEGLSEVQKHIHGREALYKGTGLRTRQNYIGYLLRPGAPPQVTRPTAPTEAVPSLVDGLLRTHRHMAQSAIPPIIHAASLSYGLLFIHPYADGNSRTHRFLLHNILAQREYTAPGELFPLSARMLDHRDVYAQSMYPFQAHIGEAVQYRWRPCEEFQHLNDTTAWFRYPDLTAQVEMVYRFVDDILEYTLPDVYTWRARFLRAFQVCSDLTHLPSRQVGILVDAIRQNDGVLSKRKQRQFALRDPGVVTACEEAVRAAYAWEVPATDLLASPAERPATTFSQSLSGGSVARLLGRRVGIGPEQSGGPLALGESQGS